MGDCMIYQPEDDLALEDLSYRKQMALATLNDAINQIYNIEGDRWQMAYDTLEAVLGNLKIEVDA
jgi:hypothetical protein